MRIRIENEWRLNTIFISLAVMLVSLFISRALLSISFIVFALACLLHKDLLQQIKIFFTKPLFIGIALLFFMPLVSGLWSENKAEWLNIVRIKLPLLVFPLAFAGKWQLKEKQWLQLAAFFLFVIACGVCWSMSRYLANIPAIHMGYLKAGVLPTPLQDDHIRFSWIVCVAIILCLLLLQRFQQRYLRIAITVTAAVFAIYLHILSARTGLLDLYIVVLIYLGWLLTRYKKSKWMISGIALIILLPLLSWWFLPTFRNKLQYILYDFSFIKTATYLPGASDGNRVLSIRAASALIVEHPGGIGAGDIRYEVNNWLGTHVPGMLDSDKLYPSSEWLVYGCTAGWIGMILFTVIMLVPFFTGGIRFRIFFILFQCTAMFSFLFDVGLEGQFGIFLYCFVLCWWWKWFSMAPQKLKYASTLQ